ncbi:FRG domain-containing protein [Permianibacter sp. IMCC34836]|uniref:FRG domain-containing protein n=1 Tax=Permianibacter fluminis TaxID=2738515 RepID=UPI00155473FF|nr:FRG domain-containing protein [Permianibacter fluminis]NQD35920.1 FRG domain-containing protein [Permianibacter fluminis]
MKPRLWCHLTEEPKQRLPVPDIRASKAKLVRSYPELVQAVAKLAFHNPEYALFYRGQSTEHFNSQQQSSCYPTLYRSSSNGRLKDRELQQRLSQLEHYRTAIATAFKQAKLPGHDKLEKFPELAWSVLQHYEVCPTPLLDVTHSLRVAASFATGKEQDGIVYVYALPHPSGTLTYSAEEELLMVRLLGICPPDAKRPYFQEGYLVGSFPVVRERRGPHLDVARRLIGKFQLRAKAFWSADFPRIPVAALYPGKDSIQQLCAGLSAPT